VALVVDAVVAVDTVPPAARVVELFPPRFVAEDVTPPTAVVPPADTPPPRAELPPSDDEVVLALVPPAAVALVIVEFPPVARELVLVEPPLAGTVADVLALPPLFVWVALVTVDLPPVLALVSVLRVPPALPSPGKFSASEQAVVNAVASSADETNNRRSFCGMNEVSRCDI
jgi:hypothetical protein